MNTAESSAGNQIIQKTVLEMLRPASTPGRGFFRVLLQAAGSMSQMGAVQASRKHNSALVPRDKALGSQESTCEVREKVCTGNQRDQSC